MIKLDFVPTGLDEINDYYGNPDPDGDMMYNQEWFSENIKEFRFPIPLAKSWNTTAYTTRFWVHKLVGPAIVDAINEIVERRGAAYLLENHLDRWGGGWNWRFKTGSRELSTHGYGISCDINPDLAPYGEPSNQPDFIVEAFTKRGFFWGGEWPFPYKDGMHFQAARDY